MSNHVTIPPETRNILPEQWRGFNLFLLKGELMENSPMLSVGTQFWGCEKCGVQTVPCRVSVNKCPNCLGEMRQYMVTQSDVEAGIDFQMRISAGL